MIIKSDFRDYYDCMMKYDEDRDTIFVRMADNQGLSIKDQRYITPYKYQDQISNRKKDGRYWYAVVGFAGHIYPIIGEDIIIYHDHAEIPKIKSQVIQLFDLENQQDFVWLPRRWTKEEYYKLFEKHGPIWFLCDRTNAPHRDTVLYKNYNLGTINFAKILPPQIAYNNLRNYVFNIARPMKPIPVMPNDVKIEQHGFNLKTSFRSNKSDSSK